MTITPIGFLLIPLGIILFLLRPGWLYYLLVFFAPFSATSILNSGNGDSGSGLQPSIFVGTLLLLRKLIDCAYTLRIRVSRRLRLSVALAASFGLVCALSLVMPIVAGGKIEVMSSGLLLGPSEPLHFKTSNITGTVAVWIGICLAAYIAQRNLDPQMFQKTLRIYLASGIFVCAWGLLQFVLYLVNIPYPAGVFNNSASPYALGYDKPLASINIVRISSVGLEPGVFATALIGILPIALTAAFGNRVILGSRTDKIAFFLILTCMVLTTSATGYFSLIAAGCILAFTLLKYKRITVKPILYASIFSALLFISYAVVPQVKEAAQEVLLSKADSWSALERGTIILNDLQYFLRYPLLGLGWGSAPTHDLTMGILANCGILGLLGFLAFVGYLLSRLWSHTHISFPKNEPCNPAHIMFLSLFGTIIAFVVGGLPGGPNFWLIVGLSMAATAQTETLSCRSVLGRWASRLAGRSSGVRVIQ